MKISHIEFPEYAGKRCLMMPYIQGDPDSVPEEFREGYEKILSDVYFARGDVGFLTIDESPVEKGTVHRSSRSTTDRAIHTEAGINPEKIYTWGSSGWGRSHKVELDRDAKVLLASNIDRSCAIWDVEHANTSLDGDLGEFLHQYPLDEAELLRAGDVHQIGILTPHESLPVKRECKRQFFRIISSGVFGREDYFTKNPLINQ